MGLNRALGEHICLALQPAILVQYFQRAEQVIAAVIGKGQPVRPVVDKAVFSGEIVIAAVQLGHLRLDVGIRRGGVHLQFDELLHTVPQPHQPLTRASAVAFRSGRTMRLFSRKYTAPSTTV